MGTRIMQSNGLIKGFRQYQAITDQHSAYWNLTSYSGTISLLYGERHKLLIEFGLHCLDLRNIRPAIGGFI